MKGFRKFVSRGNLVELATAFIMGAAFTTVVTAFTDLIMNVIAKMVGNKPNFDRVTIAEIPVGPFITATVNFLLVALVVYYLLVKPLNAWRDRHKKSEEESKPTEVELLTQIRDLLAKDRLGQEKDTTKTHPVDQ